MVLAAAVFSISTRACQLLCGFGRSIYSGFIILLAPYRKVFLAFTFLLARNQHRPRRCGRSSLLVFAFSVAPDRNIILVSHFRHGVQLLDGWLTCFLVFRLIVDSGRIYSMGFKASVCGVAF